MEYDALTLSTVSLEANCGYADTPLMQVVADKRRPRPEMAFEEAEAALGLRSLLDLQVTLAHTYAHAYAHTYSHAYSHA